MLPSLQGGCECLNTARAARSPLPGVPAGPLAQHTGLAAPYLARMSDPSELPTHDPLGFLRERVQADLDAGRFVGPVQTRFPPEPNGFLHVGHAKAICIDFSVAQAFGGACLLRFDDTNPVAEEARYAEAIREDLAWLGFAPSRVTHTSDHFDRLVELAGRLIDAGLAYVDEQPVDEIRAQRGSLTRPGTASPFRDRPVLETKQRFEQMKSGAAAEGSMVLRARIDMAAPNLNLRDPVLYRVLHAAHPRTGEAWKVYPTYDFAHGQCDAIEGITHSLCSLEFEDHRPLYEWFLEKLELFPSRQIEFGRLNLTHTITSKRKLKALVDEGHVDGWDDPRLPTLAGMRRRGYAPAAIRSFCDELGATKFVGTTELALLEHHQRKFLNEVAERRMGVMDPIELVVTDFEEGRVDLVPAVNRPQDGEEGETRQLPFTGSLWIEREDFKEDANRKFFRLTPGREVRLRWAYLVTCTGCEKDDAGNVVRVFATHDPASRGGNAPDGRKVKGTIHWVSRAHAVDAECRLYRPLFATADPAEGSGDEPPRDWRENLEPDSLEIVRAKAEASLADARVGEPVQLERVGYFHREPGKSLVFHRVVALREDAGKSKG